MSLVPSRHAPRCIAFVTVLAVLLLIPSSSLAANGPGGKKPTTSPAAVSQDRVPPPPLGRVIDGVQLGKRLDFEKGKGRFLHLLVDYPDTWSEAPSTFYNSRKLVDVPQAQRGVVNESSRIKIYTEQRLDHADALKQIREFAAGIGAAPTDYLTLAGWPALQTTYVENRPQPDHAPKFADPKVLRIATWIAVGDVLVRVDASLPSAAKGRLVAEAKAIARSVAFDTAGKSDAVQREVESLQQAAAKVQAPPSGASLERDLGATAPTEEDVPLAGASSPGYNQRVFFSGFGELEIAVSPDGQNVVIGKNVGAWTGSNDGGQTFPNAGSVGNFNCGDPSMAWGQSGAFYYAGIHCGCTPGNYPAATFPGTGPFGWNCNAVARSTNNGVSFPVTARPMVMCESSDPAGIGPNPAGYCFPDQEHIAADRVNAGSGGDQVYSTWRNFDATDQDAAVVCSQDSGANWTLPLDLASSSSFPRIAAGQDGFVYVTAYSGGNFKLWKLNSCANGLTVVGGFPVNVAASPAGPCPFAGHDRCDQNPTSQTVVVDDTNPNHLYFAFSSITGPTNDNIVVRHSTDGGSTWSAPVQANAAIPGQRIMPWLCSTGGDAFLTWYDRRNAPVCNTPPCPGINNDRTDFYGAQVGVDFGGNLQALGDFVISEAPDNWCSSGWPCGTRDQASSESCSFQPQLAGSCIDTQGNGDPSDDVNLGQRCDFSDCGGANVDITYPNATCQCTLGDQTNIQCQTGGGCPKYGDYNGNACTAGRLYAGWASLTSPPGVPPPTSNIGVLFDSLLVGEVPHLQVPGTLDFGTVCVNSTTKQTLNVCNTGTSNLEVQPITSDNTQFVVTTPSGGYPVRISPDFCFPFEVKFTPTSAGVKTATLTIRSDDPTNPVETVTATGTAGNQNIVTTFAPDGSFGDVCLNDTKNLDLTIHNSGGCPLIVSNITSNNTKFKVGSVGTYPLVIEGGDSVAVPLQFAPTLNTGPFTGDITIASNDPDTPSDVVSVSGNAPDAVIDAFVGDAGAFGKVCVESVYKELPFTIQNNGACPLDIDSVTLVGGDAGDFQLPVLPATTTLEPANSIVIPVRFDPTSFLPLATRTTTVRVSGRTLYSTLTLPDDDTTVNGVAPPPDINVPDANGGTSGTVSFGSVCAGVVAEKEIPVCNTGECNLDVTSATLLNGCDDFTIVANPFPAVVSPDFCIPLKVQYTPTEAGHHECTLQITSNDPDENPIDIVLVGDTPFASIDVPESQYFLPEVVQTVDNCSTAKNLPISNNGSCPLVVTDVSVTTNADEYSLDGLPSFPIPLQPGHTLGDGDLRDVFAPDQPLDRDKSGQITVTYEDDPVAHTTTQAVINTCGEGVLTGARVLVTRNGSNFGTVERIQIQRIVGNRNRRPQLDTVGVFQNVQLHLEEVSDPVCPDFYYHVEWGTVSNPVQLVPGYYQVTATIRYNGKRYTKTVAFSVSACDFNPTVVVTF